MSTESNEFEPINACPVCKQPAPHQCFCANQMQYRDCPACRGKGFNCIDDLCHAQGRCMHGDTCPRCHGNGWVLPKRVLVVPDETAALIRGYARDNPNLRKAKYAVDDRDPLTGACYYVNEAYYHLTDQDLEVYCLSWTDIDPAYDGTHWYLREPDGDRQWVDLTLELMPPIEFPPYKEGTHRGWITGDSPSKRTMKVITAVDPEFEL